MKTIAEVKAEFAAADMSSYPALYEIYKEDTRSGVQKLIAQCHKKEAALEAEKQRIENMKALTNLPSSSRGSAACAT